MKIKFLLLTIFTLFIISGTTAAHIVGGDVTYKCVSFQNNTATIDIKFTMYRDLIGVGTDFDLGARFGLYQKSLGTTVWQYISTTRSDPEERNLIDYSTECVVNPPSLVVEKAEYNFTITIEDVSPSKIYQISYQRCCRNNTISNIVNPESTGAAFAIEILGSSLTTCNNSPVFTNFPPILICAGKPLIFNHGATDAEGDQLRYSFCAPLTSGGTDGSTTPGNINSCTGITPDPMICPPPYDLIVYNVPYTATIPLLSDPVIKIDSLTGLVTGTPLILGQYVVGVCVSEYRNGVLIGQIRRDFQFNVSNCSSPSSTILGEFCAGDSISVNDKVYKESGVYYQELKTATGCDSIITVRITKFSAGQSTQNVSICQGESITINDQIYNNAGTFTQKVKTSNNCDSTINIIVNVLPIKQSTQSYQICENENITINGTTYSESGTFVQNLQTTVGCDSTLTINIKNGLSTRQTVYFSLCNVLNIPINGAIYTTPGQYVQKLANISGCDSTLVINILSCDALVTYDLNACNALVPAASMEYSEFTPLYAMIPSCAVVEATNIYRDNPTMNKHSCTAGINNSIAMCVSATTSCDASTATATPITFSVKITPKDNQDVFFSGLNFHHLAPVQFSWVSGATGPNNYPTRYNIKITKNGQTVYQKTNVSTGNTWLEEKYQFTDNEDFRVVDSATIFEVELLPYCAVGNTSLISVWDIDDVKLTLSCVRKDPAPMMVTIANYHENLSQTVVKSQINGITLSMPIGQDGQLRLSPNMSQTGAKISLHSNIDYLDGVSTLDLAIIQQHILGIKTMDHSFYSIAADANNDSRVTAIDLVEIRKLILGITERFVNRESWVFVDKSQCNPVADPRLINEYIIIDGQEIPLQFLAIKIGNVSDKVD